MSWDIRKVDFNGSEITIKKNDDIGYIIIIPEDVRSELYSLYKFNNSYAELTFFEFIDKVL